MGDYFLMIQGEQRGPYGRSQLDAMWTTGAITADATYWTEGQSDWEPIGSLFQETGTQKPEASGDARAAFKFECPSCGQRISATSDQVGSAGQCPHCGNAFTVLVPSTGIQRLKWLKILAWASVAANVLGFIFASVFSNALPLLILAPVGIISGHIARSRSIASVMPRSLRRVALGGAVVGYVTVGLYACLMGFVFLMASKMDANRQHSTSSNSASSSQPRVEQIIGNEIQTALDQNKQKIFDGIHPVGTAKSIKLHDVTVTAWKNGQDTNRLDDMQQFTIRYTIYWEGPMTSDGWTKISQTYDCEANRYTALQILATNGVTNKDAGDAALNVVGALLQYQAQKSGAQEATRQYLNNQ